MHQRTRRMRPCTPFVAFFRSSHHVSLRGNRRGVSHESVWDPMKYFARIFVSLASGLIFGFGLALSGMLDPTRVRGFLDIFGAWDPTLAFVLGGAVAVSAIGQIISRSMKGPALDEKFRLPDKTTVDSPLLAGSALFGIGWGLSGLCPGPAISSLTLGIPATLVFTIAMIAGVFVHDYLPKVRRDDQVGVAPIQPDGPRADDCG